MTKKQQAEAEKEKAVNLLRSNFGIVPGGTVYCILRHCSSSGMSRDISLSVSDKGRICDISGLAAEAMADKFNRDNGGIRVSGCNMDMGFQLVYNLSYTLFPEYMCAGEKKCHSPDHSNPGPDRHKYGQEITHKDGYALRHEWL